MDEGAARSGWTRSPAVRPAATEVERGFAVPVPWRLALGLGDVRLDERYVPALRATGEFALVARVLSADELLEESRSQIIDVALVSFDLHRLSRSTLGDLARAGVRIVVLVPPGEGAGYTVSNGVALPLDSDPAAVRAALVAAATSATRGRPAATAGNASPAPGTRPDSPMPGPEGPPGAGETAVAPECAVVLVTSGAGSPGRTTVALNLAAALGAVAPTILLETDLAAPSLAAWLDLDPTRNLAVVAHAEPRATSDWSVAIEPELQPIDARSPEGVVLLGVPKPELRSSVTAPFVSRLLAELRARYRYVVIDAAAMTLLKEDPVARALLAAADEVVLAAAPDLVGLFRARLALRSLEGEVEPDRIALVLNRYRRGAHPSRQEIEWALGIPGASSIPEDARGLDAALEVQRPLVLVSRGKASRALLDLAGRLRGGRIRLPAEAERPKKRRGWPLRPRLPSLARLISRLTARDARGQVVGGRGAESPRPVGSRVPVVSDPGTSA
jgi:MinD-like ATPase involved in chromosome partitioning or flagellar assembly